ncbi:palmitoyltransferase ZDHHC23-A-like [Hippoglossus stenolepis]|uniref:palmitoyltransferase ZDHHC23-A-like n=1 Tax=Hippoglossus stenolepis TaxID=195615 RepID=UPI001FAFFD9C|nr:palmitoyltransferase ZDHHC23-A-like [Hippoglossus stenolepis]
MGWLRHKPPHSGCHSPVLGALIDDLEISMIPALVLLPLLLRAAALHHLLGIIILTALPSLVLWFYYATHRHLQLCTVTAGMILTIGSLIHTKRGPGFHTTSYHSQSEEVNKDSTHLNGSIQSAASSSSPPALTEKWSRCSVCKTMRPPRAGHCRTCGSCVKRLDHHCVWINSCVGQANHCSFLLTLLVFVLTSLYGISLVLCSICPRQYVMTAPFYCPGVYSQSRYSTLYIINTCLCVISSVSSQQLRQKSTLKKFTKLI